MTGFRSPLPTAPSSDRAASSNGWRTAPARAADGGAAGGRVPGGRRRSVPHLLVGALLVMACAVGFAVAAGSMDHRASVLALARAVTVGHRLTAADLRPVRVSTASGVATVPASDLSAVVGETAAVSLPAGALLTRRELGALRLPAGRAVVAVAVKSGQAPPGLAAGEHVLLVPTASGGGGTAGGSGPGASAGGHAAARSAGAPWSGVVTAVEPATGVQDATVVSVQLPAAAARVVAGLPAGQVDLVLVAGS